MKTTKQIAEDCGLTPKQSAYLSDLIDLIDLRFGGSSADEDELAIVGALYRRIEKLEETVAEALRLADSEADEEHPDPIDDAINVLRVSQ